MGYDELSQCFYSSADMQRFRVFAQCHREKQLLKGIITQRLTRPNSSSGCDGSHGWSLVLLDDLGQTKMSMSTTVQPKLDSRAC